MSQAKLTYLKIMLIPYFSRQSLVRFSTTRFALYGDTLLGENDVEDDPVVVVLNDLAAALNSRGDVHTHQNASVDQRLVSVYDGREEAGGGGGGLHVREQTLDAELLFGKKESAYTRGRTYKNPPELMSVVPMEM